MVLLTLTVSLCGCDWTVDQKPKTLATLCGVAYKVTGTDSSCGCDWTAEFLMV